MNAARRLPRLRQVALALVAVAMAAWLAHRGMRDLSLRDLGAAVAATEGWRLACSLALTAVSFACLAQIEALATQWVAPGRVPRREAWRTGLIAHALSNTLGFHLLTGGAIRVRAYASRGLRLGEVGRVLAGVASGVASGVACVGVIALLVWQWPAGDRQRALALGLVGLAAALVMLRIRPSRLATTDSRRGLGGQAARTLATGFIETTAAMGALYVLLPPGAIAPAGFALAFLGAMLLGLASHVPGGAGVFEVAMVAALPRTPAAQALAALLCYRAVYNLLPCALAGLALALRVGARGAGRASSMADNVTAGGAGAGTAEPG